MGGVHHGEGREVTDDDLKDPKGKAYAHVMGMSLKAINDFFREQGLDAAAIGIISAWGMIILCQLKLGHWAKKGLLSRPAFRLPGAPFTGYLTLAFLAAVLVLMAFDSPVGTWTVASLVIIIPALILAAIAPLPETVPELMLASLIAGERLRTYAARPLPNTSSLKVGLAELTVDDLRTAYDWSRPQEEALFELERHYGGPVGVNTTGTKNGEQVVSYGNSSLRLGITQLSPKEGLSLGQTGNGEEFMHDVEPLDQVATGSEQVRVLVRRISEPIQTDERLMAALRRVGAVVDESDAYWFARATGAEGEILDLAQRVDHAELALVDDEQHGAEQRECHQRGRSGGCDVSSDEHGHRLRSFSVGGRRTEAGRATRS